MIEGNSPPFPSMSRPGGLPCHGVGVAARITRAPGPSQASLTSPGPLRAFARLAGPGRSQATSLAPLPGPPGGTIDRGAGPGADGRA